MRVLIIYCHPVDRSYNAALHARVVDELRGNGHEVDDCDLYQEAFDPVMSSEERLGYHDLAHNQLPVAEHVARLQRAQALVLVFPVWNFGPPAMLKGYFDRVLLPGVSFDMSDPQHIKPGLTHLRHVVAVTTYGVVRWKAWWLGDGPRAMVKRFMRRLTDDRARIDYLACYGLNLADLGRRERFLQQVGGAMQKIN